MTYMIPNYYLIPTNHSRYHLYYYKEGKINTPSQFNSNMTFNKQLKGIPVLFIPGNSGSYKQARSIAAEAYMHINRDIPNPFDVENPNRPKKKRKSNEYLNELDLFTLNFEEELSAFGGDLMYAETEYVNQCIQVILNLYQNNQDLEYKPTSVILVAHSMGGVIARMSVLLPNHIYGSVTTIITLNTSHRNAPIYSHLSTAKFYEELNSYWGEYIQPKHFQRNNSSSQTETVSALPELPPIYDDICVISIAGGHRDTLIRSELISLDGLVDTDKSFSVITTSIPDVLMETDHQCILWCNEVVLSIVEGLLSLAHPKTKQNTYNVYERLSIIKNILHSNIPELLGYSNQFNNQFYNIKSSLSPSPLNNNSTSKTTRFDLDSITDIAKNISFEKYPLSSIVNKPSLSYRSNSQTRLTVSTSPPDSFYFHFRISDWLSDSTFFSMITSLQFDDFSIVAYEDEDLNGVVEIDQKSISFPPLPPLTKSFVDVPSTMLILPADTLKKYYSLFISFPKSSRKNRFISVFQFYNSTTSSVQIPSYPYFGEYTYLLPIGHPILVNFTLPYYTIGYPIRVSIINRQEFYFRGDLVDDLLYNQENSGGNIHRDSIVIINNNLGKSDLKESNTYPTFLPMSYHYIPQSMEEGKFNLNSTDINIKFHQSSKNITNHKGNPNTESNRKTVIQKLLMTKSIKSDVVQENSFSKEFPHLFIMSDPFSSYEISFKFDWVGSIGTLFFHYIFSFIPCTFALFLYIFSCQIKTMLLKDEFPGLFLTLRSEIPSLSVIFILVPFGISFFFKIFNLNAPILYTESFPDPFLIKTMIEIIPPFWTVPFLFIFSTCILTLLITIKTLIYMVGSLICKIILTFNVNIKSLSNRFPSFSKWIVIGLMILVVLHSAIGLIVGLLLLAFSPTFNYLLLLSSNSTSPTLAPLNSSKKLKLSSCKSTSQLFRDQLNYQKSIFLLYLFSTIIMVPKMIVWFKHLAYEWRVFDSYELFIILAITHILLSRSELSVKSLQVTRYTLMSFAGLSMIYSIILLYRMLYFIQLLSLTFIACHIWSKLKENTKVTIK